MELLYLKTLVEVVRTGSLSRAADILCVTQPAVSRRIKFLEDQYGYELLDRSGHRLRPTDAGMLVYRKAEALLEIESDLLAGLHMLKGKGKVSFGCTPSFGMAHLPHILKDFMLASAEAADLKFMFSMPEQILAGLDDGTYDLAVMESSECFDLSGHTAFALPGDEMVFASAPALGIPESATTIDALLDVPIFTRREGCCSRTLLENNLKGIGHDLREFHKVIVLDDLHVVVRAVTDGAGISFLSRDVLAEFLADGRLTSHHIDGFRHARERSLVVRRAADVDAPVAAFAAQVCRRFGATLPAMLDAAAAPVAVPRPVVVA